MHTKIDGYKGSLKFPNCRHEEHGAWRAEVEEKDRERVKTINNVIDRVTICEDRRWRKYNTRISNRKDYKKQTTQRTL